MTQPGIESRKAMKGDTKEMSIARTAVVEMVATEAFLVMAIQPTDWP
jgi:hypothetical protein